MTATNRPAVIIYTDHLLYPSQTFIRAQGGALRHYTPEYTGLRRVKGLDLPASQTHVINQGRRGDQAREVFFKLSGMAPRLLGELKALQPVLMHAHFGCDGYRALRLATNLRVPLLVSIHGSEATVTDLKGANFGHRRYVANREVLAKEATQFIAVSDFIRRKLLGQGFRDEKIKVHYIGVDTKLFLPRSDQAEPFVLFVGRLAERKGLTYLIQAMAEVQKEYPGVELVVIGDGPLRQQLEAQAKASLRQYRFLGTKAPDEVRDWMDRCSIFAAPSVRIASGEEEAFGMVFAEAQSMEKPVVSFVSGGIGEAVDHGVTGLLAPERDWQTLAQHLATLIRDANLRNRFGVAGRQRAIRLFDLDRQTQLLEQMYDGLTERVQSIDHSIAG